MSDAEDLQDWPNLLRKLAIALGRDMALELAARFGGIPVYVPVRYSPQHLWSAVVTEADWPAVVAVCGRQHLCLPRGTYLQLAKRKILEMAERGASAREIALALRVSQRHVQRVVSGLDMSASRAPVDPRQAKLFE